MNAHQTPYKGLAPFREEDSSYFFGRERETRLIIASLYASPLTLVYGTSGAGKTSVLQAGVLPALRNRSDVIPIYFTGWQVTPVEKLKSRAIAACREAAPDLVKPSESLSLSDTLKDLARQSEKRLMIILDQFDEAFLYLDPGDTAFAEIGEALASEDMDIRFLISIREDALARLDVFEEQVPSLFDCYQRVEPLEMECARLAITKPLEQFYEDTGRQFTVEPALVKSVLEQVRVGEVSLATTLRAPKHNSTRVDAPYLQLVMKKLFEAEVVQDDNVIELATLERLGGAGTIVRSHLDSVMGSLTSEERHTAALLFGYLLTPSGNKIAYSARDLAEYTDMPEPKVTAVLESMASAEVRLVKPASEATDFSGPPRYEIFHDVLSQPIADWRQRYQRSELENKHRNQRRRLLALSSVLIVLLLFVSGAYIWNSGSNAPRIVKGIAGTTALGSLLLSWEPVTVGSSENWTYEIEVLDVGTGTVKPLREIYTQTLVNESDLFGHLRWRIRGVSDESKTAWSTWQDVSRYANAWDRICDTGVVNVGIGKTDDFFVTISDADISTPEGPEIDLLRFLLNYAMTQDPNCSGEAPELRAHVVEWDDLIDLPRKDDSIDILASRISRTPIREQEVGFTCPTIVYPPAIVTRVGDQAFENGKVAPRLGAQNKTSNSDLAKRLLTEAYGKFDPFGPDGLPSVLTLDGPSLVLWHGNDTDFLSVDRLIDNQIDGIVMDYPFASFLRRERQQPIDIHPLSNEPPEQIAFAMRLREKELADALNSAIRQNPDRLTEFRDAVCESATGSGAACRPAPCP